MRRQPAACAVRCPFGSLSLYERSQLNSLIRHQLYEKGKPIFVQGSTISGCYVLCQGKVQLAHCTRDGRTQIVKFLKDGDCFGEEGFWQASSSSVLARALTDSVAGWISSADLQELLRRNSSLALEAQKRLAGEVKELRVRLAEQAYLGTRERLIKLIVELGEWVCKQIGVLKSRGLIAYRRGELIILNETELLRYITPPP